MVTGARGIRNHNPGNIRLNPNTTWSGQVPAAQQTDASFVQFTDPVFGIRAIARILNTYAARGLTTLDQIIRTWAPPNENDTEAYVKSAEKNVGISRHVPLPASLKPILIAAIIQHENGTQPYSLDTIIKGISLA